MLELLKTPPLLWKLVCVTKQEMLQKENIKKGFQQNGNIPYYSRPEMLSTGMRQVLHNVLT